MITELMQMLQRDEQVKFSIARVGDNKARITVMPLLSGNGEGLSDDAMQARANLATPLIVEANVGELEDVFMSAVKERSEFRRDAHSDYQRLTGALAENHKSVQNAAAKAKDSKASGCSVPKATSGKTAEPEEPSASAADTVKKSGGLF